MGDHATSTPDLRALNPAARCNSYLRRSETDLTSSDSASDTPTQTPTASPTQSPRRRKSKSRGDDGDVTPETKRRRNNSQKVESNLKSFRSFGDIRNQDENSRPKASKDRYEKL